MNDGRLPQRVRVPHLQIFLDLAVSAKAVVLMSGDADLLVLVDQLKPLRIQDPEAFQAWLPPIG